MTPEARARFIDFAAGTDCLFMDAHFLPEELPAHRGWGHSSWEEAVEAAEGCRAKTLRLIHHAPWRTDDELDAILAAAKRRFPATVM